MTVPAGNAENVDLIVLDVMLPGEDGFSICGRLRAVSNIPIIMLTALGHDVDRIVGLEIGADDYVNKPFTSRELVARIRAAKLRRVRISGGQGRKRVGPRRLRTRHIRPNAFESRGRQCDDDQRRVRSSAGLNSTPGKCSRAINCWN